MRVMLSDIADRETNTTLDFDAAFHARPGLAVRFAALHAVLHTGSQALARDVALDTALGALLRELGPRAVPAAALPDGRVADAIAFLDSRLDDAVTLADLAGVAGLRRRQTIAAFRRATGLPPHAWQVQRRVERVKHLLRQGVPPAAAAAEAGFADQSHMGRHFAAIVGVTPAAYARGRD